MSEDTTQADPQEFVKGLLGKTVRVEIVDGRMFEGQVYCFDSSCNLILSDTYSIPKQGQSLTRELVRVPSSVTGDDCPRARLGHVLVGGKHLVKCELARDQIANENQ